MNMTTLAFCFCVTCSAPLASAQHADNAPHSDHAKKKATTESADTQVQPYTLGTCAVSGKELGSMGEAIVKTYDGREVRLCCAGCIGAFEADLQASWKKVDEATIKDQLPYYPLETCLVTGEEMSESGSMEAVNIVYANRLVRLCCKMCKKKFSADPGKYIQELDHAVIEDQQNDYPLDTCGVSGGKLGSMGDPVEMVVAGRLVKLCCGGCRAKLNAEPSKYLQNIDNAWQEQGRYMPIKQTPKTGD